VGFGRNWPLEPESHQGLSPLKEINSGEGIKKETRPSCATSNYQLCHAGWLCQKWSVRRPRITNKTRLSNHPTRQIKIRQTLASHDVALPKTRERPPSPIPHPSNPKPANHLKPSKVLLHTALFILKILSISQWLTSAFPHSPFPRSAPSRASILLSSRFPILCPASPQRLGSAANVVIVASSAQGYSIVVLCEIVIMVCWLC
jgi:hypothetical protein